MTFASPVYVGISCRHNAWLSSERFYFKPGVICKTVAIKMIINPSGFQERIPLKCVSGFSNIVLAPYFFKRNNGMLRSENSPYLSKFMGIIRGKNQFFLHCLSQIYSTYITGEWSRLLFGPVIDES